MSLKLVSEDQRRKLFEFGNGEWKIAKYLEVKEDSVIGNHYHKLKDECFLLIEGEMEVVLGERLFKAVAPIAINVPRGLYHSFNMKAGAKLIGLCSELFNKEDDYL